ncbi:MAG TPA: hypothetical protein DD725_01380 [Deltaproteobacteria bacterium]|nr:hypothetical protein [Deltaproteobacteria bacterium]
MKKILLGVLAGVMILAFTAVSSFAEGNYWDGWKKTTPLNTLEIFPDCGINVLGAGGDDILQATVDIYCGVKPGGYVGYVNPKVYDIFKKKGKKYPDGKTAVLVFKKIGAAFTTDHKDGQPIYDVVAIKDGKSIASKEAGHPLNPATCAKCHVGFNDICKKLGYLCGNRM